MQIKNLNEIPHYLEHVAQWWHDEWQHFSPQKKLETRIQALQDYLQIDKPCPTVWLALENNQLLGTAAIVEDDLPAFPHGLSPWLASVYVDKPYRQQGIGTKLIQHIIAFAKQQAFSQLALFTEYHRAWYQQLGFNYIEKQQLSGYDITIMQMNLKET